MQREGKLKVMNVGFFAIRNSAAAFYFIEPSPCYAVVLMPNNGLQIGGRFNAANVLLYLVCFNF